MMEEPAFKPILLQPLKMQGVVDIKDTSLIVRFKFMARPKNPSMIQRMAIRRMYESLPKLGIEFAAAALRLQAAAPPIRAAAPTKAAAAIGDTDTRERRAPWKSASSAIRVSNSPRIAFGGNVFGWTADEATSHKLLDAFVDAGFSFVDTADVYSRWVPGNKGGESETVIGSWLKKDPAKRDKVLIATKCGMEMPAERPGPVARPHQALGRRLAEAAQHRPHRPLPVAPRRQGDAAGGDALDLRRADQGGQAARHRRLELRGAAPRRSRRRSPRTRACRATRACSRTTI